MRSRHIEPGSQPEPINRQTEQAGDGPVRYRATRFIWLQTRRRNYTPALCDQPRWEEVLVKSEIHGHDALAERLGATTRE